MGAAARLFSPAALTRAASCCCASSRRFCRTRETLVDSSFMAVALLEIALQGALGLRDQLFLRRQLGARAAHDGDGGAKLADRKLGERKLVYRALRIVIHPDAQAAPAQRRAAERYVLLRTREHVGDVLQVTFQRRRARLGGDVAFDRLRELALDRLHLGGDRRAILDDA